MTLPMPGTRHLPSSLPGGCLTPSQGDYVFWCPQSPQEVPRHPAIGFSLTILFFFLPLDSAVEFFQPLGAIFDFFFVFSGFPHV